MTEFTDPFTLDIAISSANTTAIECLSQHCDLSKQRLKEAMSKGAVWLQKSPEQYRSAKPVRRANKVLPKGGKLYLYYDAKVLSQIPNHPTLIYENEHYGIWNKPYGMLSHGSKWGDHCSITRWINQHHQPTRTTFLIHRLDKAASGIMLIAYNKKSAALLSRLFEERQIKKTYQAIVHGHPERTPLTIDSPIDGKNACSTIESCLYDHNNDRSLLQVAISTGRKHQIRKHLSSIQYPIVGDRLYCPQEQLDLDIDLQLRAYELEFSCPIISKKQVFTLPPTLQLQL